MSEPQAPERGTCPLCGQSVRGVRMDDGQWLPVEGKEHAQDCVHYKRGLGKTREGYEILETGVLRTGPPDHEVDVWYEVVEIRPGDARVDLRINPKIVHAPRHLSLKGWLRIVKLITQSLKQHDEKARAREHKRVVRGSL